MFRKQSLKKPSVARGVTYFLWLVFSLLSNPASAQEHQSMDDLQYQAKLWIDGQLQGSPQDYQVEFRALDPRLRLARCQEPLSFEVHGNNELRGRSNIRVTCHSEDWFIFITADVRIFSPVVVAKNSLNRGDSIDESFIEIKKMDVSRIRGDYFTSTSSVIGMQVRNRIRPGQVITPRQLNSVQAISRGDQVIIRASSSSLTIRMTGEALEAGNLGEQIRVRNLQSGRTIHARIVEQGIVEVRL